MTTPLLAFGMPAEPEWIFIGILALVLFGPKKLPELARGLGKAMAELQKAKEDFHREITGVPPLPKIQQPEGLQGVTPPAQVPLTQENGAANLTVSSPDAFTTTPVALPAESAPSVPSEEKKG